MDLAGSERIRDARPDSQLRETSSINRSLFTLGKVAAAPQLTPIPNACDACVLATAAALHASSASLERLRQKCTTECRVRYTFGAERRAGDQRAGNERPRRHLNYNLSPKP